MQTVLPHDFLETVRPSLERGDASGLAHVVSSRWKPSDLCHLLIDSDPEVRQTTAVVLGLVGDRRSVACLTRALHDENAQVNAMAEYALWSIWFRLVPGCSAGAFRDGLDLLAAEKPLEAVRRFRDAIDADRSYSEAWNQCALAHFLLDQNQAAVRCCEQALNLMPCHFGAAAGMGHAHAALGQWRSALRCYRQALRINPRLDEVAAAKRRIARRVQVDDPNDASGVFEPLHIV